MATYKKNFITSVVFRIDYLGDFTKYFEKIPDELDTIIQKQLQTKDTKITKNEEIRIDSLNNTIKRNVIEVKEHNYYGNDKLKRIAFSPKYYFCEFKKYYSYEDFISYITPFLGYSNENLKDLAAKRIGLRYINEFVINEGTILDWNNYLNKNLISSINFLDPIHDLCRAFSNNEYLISGNRVIIQYGMHNPDYPGKIVKKIFVFDVDVSKQGNLLVEDIIHFLEEAHSIQESIYEKAITEGMRSYLNA